MDLPVLGATLEVGPVIGAEREYRLFFAGARIDARALWPRLSCLGQRLDPGDPQARRGSWGGVVTVDGRDAEVVTPPLSLTAGCTRQLHDSLATGAEVLASALPATVELHGYSTHLNVEVPDHLVVDVARLVTRRFAPVIMLALDRADSPGLLVRPRRGRLELCGEFAVGRQLRTALTLAIAVTRHAQHLLGSRSERRAAVALRARHARAVERYGWYVDRAAFGADLYAEGRATRLRTARLGLRAGTAGDLLAGTWARARNQVENILDVSEIHEVDRLVDGKDPLPCESPCQADEAPRTPVPFRDYTTQNLGGLTLTVEAATWQSAVLRVDDGHQRRWLTIPGRSLDGFLDMAHHPDARRELASIVSP